MAIVVNTAYNKDDHRMANSKPSFPPTFFFVKAICLVHLFLKIIHHRDFDPKLKQKHQHLFTRYILNNI